jgi:hypothetical protein
MNSAFWINLAVVVAVACLPASASAQVCNLKVVTDANPDYSDMDSMVHSITSKWKTPAEKNWAMFYWTHIARRQTSPMYLHGLEEADPIKQFNDYGYAMCSTVAGINCAIWDYMGMPVKFWDISAHTVSECFYDGGWHVYDNSMSAIYTLCDGKTIAGVQDVGKDGACAASGGKTEPGHIAKYHCLTSTSNNGFLTGADTLRDLAQEYACFAPNALKYRFYFNNWNRGHRYILNLRDNETYTRFYHRLDVDSPNAKLLNKEGHKGDVAYYVPNPGEDGKGKADPEVSHPNYRIRGNGVRVWTPDLANVEKSAHSSSDIQAASAPARLVPVRAGAPGEVIYKVEGANVITSMTIKADFQRKTADDANAILISTNNGLSWKEVWKNEKTAASSAEIKLIEQVSGTYEVLVKFQLLGKATPEDASVAGIQFETITQINSKTQPRLKLGKNTVYIGAGDQTESTVFWPDLSEENYKPFVHEIKNMLTRKVDYRAAMYMGEVKEPSYVVFKMDAPRDIVSVTYGARMANRYEGNHIDFLHSFDGGKTWKQSYSLTSAKQPWDFIHYETIKDVPPGTRSVLFKYAIEGPSRNDAGTGLFAVRMEANYNPADETTARKPMEVTFTWKERQEDYKKFVERSHTQMVEKLPFKYDINVGGFDHPVMESLRLNVKNAAPASPAQPNQVKYGYSDGRDVGGKKFQERWMTVGKNLSEGKPYTCSKPSLTTWGAGDSKGTVLTDGIVGSPEAGGIAYRWGALWDSGEVDIVVDLGKSEKCGAFRVQTTGYPFHDAMQGEVQDDVEVFTSADGKEFVSQGKINFKLRWKDFAANYFWNQDERFTGHNFELLLDRQVEAKFVKFTLKPKRALCVSEVQVLDFIKYKPFDLKLAMPDER